MTKEELKELLKDTREVKNLTHEQVANLVSKNLPEGKSISRQYYGMIENSDRTPSVDVAKAIAKILEISWTIFFEVDSNQTLPKSKCLKRKVI